MEDDNAEARGGNFMKKHYSTVTEVFDFGPHISKVILDVGSDLAGARPEPAQFEVAVSRTAEQGKELVWPQFMGEKPEDSTEGLRTVTNLYVSDKEGHPSDSGSHLTLELLCHPLQSLGSVIWFNGTYNVSVQTAYTVTQKAPLSTNGGVLKDMIFTENDGNRILLADRLQTGSFSHPLTPLSYVYYEPPAAKDSSHPLIIWLHGAGEGGSEPLITVIGNKVVNLLSPEIQRLFGGAYLLAPQSPTYWMDDGGGEISLSGSSIYVDALDGLISRFLTEHPAVDRNRIYIGGCSNGGFMTMKMILHTPERYAAAFPVCEALPDAVISDGEIQSIARLPIWFTHSRTDTVVAPEEFVIPTYRRLVDAGNENAHFTFWDKVEDATGLYKAQDGSPFEYMGHWSWIPMLNNECRLDYDRRPVTLCGKPVTILEWLAGQRKEAAQP